MAATERKGRRSPAVALSCALLVICGSARADDSADARGQVSHIANALSEGNASAAMTPIDKSYASYDKLRNYFAGMTAAFQIANEISVSDEQDQKDQITLSVHWDITLTDLQTNYTESRSSDLEIKLLKLKGKWKIVDIEPIDIFNPARTHAAGPDRR